MTTEDRPHVLFPKVIGSADAHVLPSYKEAYARWTHVTKFFPGIEWVIATIGRTIDPSAPIIDVNE
jgi:hypothetical protein